MGTQGREVKTKSLKKKGYRGRDPDDSDEENVSPAPKSKSSEIPFMSTEEIEDVIRKDKILEDCPDELVTEIAQQLFRQVSLTWDISWENLLLGLWLASQTSQLISSSSEAPHVVAVILFLLSKRQIGTAVQKHQCCLHIWHKQVLSWSGWFNCMHSQQPKESIREFSTDLLTLKRSFWKCYWALFVLLQVKHIKTSWSNNYHTTVYWLCPGHLKISCLTALIVY